MELSALKNKVCEESFYTALMGSIGYLSIWAVTDINPMVGAVFGASYHVASLAVETVFSPYQKPEALIGAAIKTAISATAVFKLLGIALSLKTIVIVGVWSVIVGPIAYQNTLETLNSISSRLPKISYSVRSILRG